MFFRASTIKDYITATSYMSLGEADETMASTTTANEWGTLDDGVKKAILNKCSLFIDGLFSYQYFKKDEAQLLKFPRGTSSEIPQGIKYAVCSLALSFITGESFKNIKSETIGKLKWEFFNNNSASDEVLAYLRPFQLTSIQLFKFNYR